MSFAIMRMQKLKQAGKIQQTGRHNARITQPKNADSERTENNKTIIDGGEDLYKTVIEKIESVGAKKRKDSVLAEEIVLSASPEFFRPDNPEAYGTYDENKTVAWAMETKNWLQENFGDNIVDLRFHLDEATPHFHAVVVPLTADNRLCANDVFNPRMLRKYQTSYAKKLEPLGISRGLEGSKAKHTTMKEIYRINNDIKKQYVKSELPNIEKKNFLNRVFETEKDIKKQNQQYKEYVKPLIIEAGTARIWKKKALSYQEKASKLQTENDILKEENRELNETITQVQKENRELNETNEKLREIPSVKELEEDRAELEILRNAVERYEEKELAEFDAKYEDEMEL